MSWKKSSREKTEIAFFKKTEKERAGRLNENIWGRVGAEGGKVCQKKRLLF